MENSVEWEDAKMFDNKELLGKGMKMNQTIPFVLGNSKFKVVKKESEEIIIGKHTSFYELDRHIIGILACGKCMSVFQLLAYLMAGSNYIGIKSLIARMKKLQEFGIINVIYLSKTGEKFSNEYIEVDDEEKLSEFTVLYQLSRGTYNLSNLLSIPMDCPDSTRILYEKNRGIYKYLTKTLIANQVLLNLLTYRDDIIKFYIEKLYSTFSAQSYEIPLYVETKTEKLMFFVWNMATGNEILDTCAMYKEQNNKEIKSVFLVNRLEEVDQIRERMQIERKENFIQIGFSTISSWFVEKQGEIIWLNLIEEDNIVNPAVCN